MNALAELATTALLGTERRPPDWPAPVGPLGSLLARIPHEPVEKALLQTAGVLGTCQLAGLLPAKNDSAIIPAAEDTVLADARVDFIDGVFADGPDRLIAEALQKIAVLPHRLLPKALECGRRCLALRPFLFPVLGNRGLWLAAQNDAWKFAGGTTNTEVLSDEVWNHGSLDQRTLYLITLRATDAAKARELIASALSAEGAKERIAFVQAMATGLTLEDEALLEATLVDKSKEARQTAARLLSTLPESRFALRMVARMQSCLKSEKKFLRGTVITLEAPAAYDPSWTPDLIEEAKPKGLGMGERAWWLFQTVRHVPLRWWEEQTGQKPAELLDWAQKSDWKDALLQGWAEAQALQRRVEWAEAFLGIPLPPNGPFTLFDLLETLPPALREIHLLKLVTDHDSKSMVLSTVLDRFIKGLPFDAPQLSATTASRLIRILKQRIHSGEVRYDWQLRAPLVELACLIPPAAFDEFANGWELTREEAQPFAEAIARVGMVIDQRKQLLNLTPVP